MSYTAKDQAVAQVQGIYEMVNALDVDYDRLEELRDARDGYCADVGNLASAEVHLIAWAQDNPEDAKELTELEESAGDCESEDDARQRIEEDALSVEVRSDWCAPGEEMTAGEFRIVLCTGGPHVELVGELDDYKQPSRVQVFYYGWGESGELFYFDREKVLKYCSCFYFGE